MVVLLGVHPAGEGRRRAGPEQRGNGAASGYAWFPGAEGEERPGSGRLRVTTPCDHQIWSALRHAGYAVGPRADGDHQRGGAGRACRRGDPAGDGGPVGADCGAEGRAGQGRTVPGGGPRVAMVPAAVMIALGGTSMSGIAVL